MSAVTRELGYEMRSGVPAAAADNTYLFLVPQRDLYDVLGISDDQDIDGIKAVYRQLARTFHPDVNSSPDAVEHFREITEAYVVLADPEKRKAYDRQRRRSYRGTEEEIATYLGLRLAGIDLGGILGVSVTVRRRTLLPDEPEELPSAPALASRR